MEILKSEKGYDAVAYQRPKSHLPQKGDCYQKRTFFQIFPLFKILLLGQNYHYFLFLCPLFLFFLIDHVSMLLSEIFRIATLIIFVGIIFRLCSYQSWFVLSINLNEDFKFLINKSILILNVYANHWISTRHQNVHFSKVS